VQITDLILLVLYGCEYRSLNLREEKKFRVAENTVLTRISEAKKDVKGGYIKFCCVVKSPAADATDATQP
jgi:hypothetical protein